MTVLGSLVQEAMTAPERRQVGVHYTGEADIMKVLRELFVAELEQQLDAASGRVEQLQQLHGRMAAMQFLDPACGCGDFLILAYRELQRLEQLLLTELQRLKCSSSPRVSASQFHGIELLELPARIARATMAANIVEGNALRMNWRDRVAPAADVFVLGNPPFVGKKEQSAEQKHDMQLIWGDVKGARVLDYVSCWFRKAAEYCQGSGARCAFVATNSITQGEQNGVLWTTLRDLGVEIDFAHRSFAWTSEARGKAHVHVVIIGFSTTRRGPVNLYEYADSNPAAARVAAVARINSYLVEGPDVRITSRPKPLCTGAPEIDYGSFALDGGHFTLDDRERDEIIAADAGAARHLRPFFGGKELIQGRTRWCVWLDDVDAESWQTIAPIRDRVARVRAWRRSRGRATTRELARTPAVFAEIRQPVGRYLAIPTLSSVQRMYIPMDFLEPDTIASNQLYVIESANLFHFGVLSSSMHMAWIRAVSGRFKSDYRYSAKVVYNNFPWPMNVSPKHACEVVSAAQGVIDARLRSAGSLAEKYDDLGTHAELREAHDRLDRAVERCYRARPLASERARTELLFALHRAISSGDLDDDRLAVD